jgi:trehalose 6-phosphate phosphatase
MPMCRPLLPDERAKIRKRVRDAGYLSLFLDFDGTLTPIVDDPAEACLDPQVRAVLQAQAARDDTLLAFVSGRALADLRPRVGVERAIYAGNHGLEISGGGLGFVEPSALAKRERLRQMVDQLTAGLRHIPGARVEYKTLTASVHFRQAACAATAITEIVRAAVAPHVSLFQLNQGKMVLEIVPRTDWHKGKAVSWINTRLAMAGAASIYIGDDRTDEDAYAQLLGEITIQVGRTDGTSAARYFLQDPTEVHSFLQWLSDNR